jgi:hypothetical protein
MKKQLPPLTVSMIALTACGNRVGLNDKMQDEALVTYCETQASCSPKLLRDAYLFYCVDQAQDERFKAKTIGCEPEFNDVLACGIKEAPTNQCRSDFDDYDDWSDDREDEYYSSDNPCEDELEDYAECVNDFMGIESSSNSYYD